jgi:hypothetical protein
VQKSWRGTWAHNIMPDILAIMASHRRRRRAQSPSILTQCLPEGDLVQWTMWTACSAVAMPELRLLNWFSSRQTGVAHYLCALLFVFLQAVRWEVPQLEV